MPRRSILSAAERENLLALPDTDDELIRHYTFSESDLSIINQRRGHANRLGFAVQLCYLRFPGIILGVNYLTHRTHHRDLAGYLRRGACTTSRH
jgi:TnpA family transposase